MKKKMYIAALVCLLIAIYQTDNSHLMMGLAYSIASLIFIIIGECKKEKA